MTRPGRTRALVLLGIHGPTLALLALAILAYADLRSRIDASPRECTGTIPHEDVLAAVGAYGGSVFDCHGEALGRDPGLAGKLGVELEVDARGRVSSARVVGMLDEPGLVSCIEASASTWTFPPPSGGACARVLVPFILGDP